MAAPTLGLGTWQGAWSFNLKPSAASLVDLTALRNDLRTLAASFGIVWSNTGIEEARNPEVSTVPLGLGLGRNVLTVTAWMRTTRFVSMRSFNAQLARALLRQISGEPVDAAQASRLAEALNSDGDASHWSESIILREAVLGGLGPIGVAAALSGPVIASCAASFRRYEPASPPRPAELPGGLARVAANPVDRSTNPARVGSEEPVFRVPGLDWPVSPTELKVIGAVVGGVVVLGVIGYTLRSYAVARIASA